MRPMSHAYTNRTSGDGKLVVKKYVGPGAAERGHRECHALRALRGIVPVPAVITAESTTLTLQHMPGDHGQDLIRAGRSVEVMSALGSALRRLHNADTRMLDTSVPTPGTGTVIVHGDYGPNNVLVDPRNSVVTAVLDWEWAHLGDPIEDLAWCEWIVRAIDPVALPFMNHFYAAYGATTPDWPVRKAAMIRRLEEVVAFTRAWDPRSARLRRREDQLANTPGPSRRKARAHEPQPGALKPPCPGVDPPPAWGLKAGQTRFPRSASPTSDVLYDGAAASDYFLAHTRQPRLVSVSGVTTRSSIPAGRCECRA